MAVGKAEDEPAVLEDAIVVLVGQEVALVQMPIRDPDSASRAIESLPRKFSLREQGLVDVVEGEAGGVIGTLDDFPASIRRSPMTGRADDE